MREGLSALQNLDHFVPVATDIVALTTSFQTLVTGASGPTNIKSILCCNNTGGALTVTLEFLPSGASTGAAYQMAFSLPANTISELVGAGPIALSVSELFKAKASAASNGVTMKVTYAKETGT